GQSDGRYRRRAHRRPHRGRGTFRGDPPSLDGFREVRRPRLARLRPIPAPHSRLRHAVHHPSVPRGDVTPTVGGPHLHRTPAHLLTDSRRMGATPASQGPRPSSGPSRHAAPTPSSPTPTK